MIGGYRDGRLYETPRKALEIAEDLNAWAESHAKEFPEATEEMVSEAQAAVTITESTLTVEFCGHVVWCDQVDSSEDLTLRYCLQQFARAVGFAGQLVTCVPKDDPDDAVREGLEQAGGSPAS